MRVVITYLGGDLCWYNLGGRLVPLHIMDGTFDLVGCRLVLAVVACLCTSSQIDCASVAADCMLAAVHVVQNKYALLSASAMS